MQQQFMTETEIFLSIWPVISMNICQHVYAYSLEYIQGCSLV